MPVYKVQIIGRDAPLYMKADSKSEVTNAVMQADALTGEQVIDALAEGVKLWKVGDPLPGTENDPATPAPTPDAGTAQDTDAAANAASAKRGGPNANDKAD